MSRLPKLTALLAAIAFVTSLAAPSRLHAARLQSACPTSTNVTSNNGVLSIDSAIEETSSGCQAGTTIDYWVDIPASGSHSAGWHEFLITANTYAWLDLTRNELHATEFPAGTYEFAACASQCVYTGAVSLSVPNGSLNGGFNPWAGGASNMQWNKTLCEFNGSCDYTTQQLYGWYMSFPATANNTGDGSNDCPANCLYHNLNAYFVNRNPNDDQGFTQLVLNKRTAGYFYSFVQYSNTGAKNVVYCRTNSAVTIGNPSDGCASGLNSYDGAEHAFWANVTPAASCTDKRYQCLKVYDDGRYLADEQMVYGGALNRPNLQNESYATDGCTVWGAQLSYLDYSMISPCALNNQLAVHYQTDTMYYQASIGGGWNWLYVNAGDAGTRLITNQGSTRDVYCGPFDSQYAYSTQVWFGTYSNMHPCMGGPPT